MSQAIHSIMVFFFHRSSCVHVQNNNVNESPTTWCKTAPFPALMSWIKKCCGTNALSGQQILGNNTNGQTKIVIVSAHMSGCVQCILIAIPIGCRCWPFIACQMQKKWIAYFVYEYISNENGQTLQKKKTGRL